MLLLIATIGVLISALGSAPGTPTFDPYTGRKPVIVLLETNPWLVVTGSDTPVLVVYENRLAIQLRRNEGGEAREYVAQTLDEATYTGLLGRLEGRTSGIKWKSSYDAAAGVDDLSETKVYLRIKDTTVVAQIYGFDAVDFGDAAMRARRKQAAAQVPPALRAVVNDLRTVRLPAGKKWQAAYVEVMLWPYEHAPDPSVKWPARWPGLQSDRSVPWGNDSYSIYLPGREERALVRFLSTRKPRGAVDLAKKKWAVEYRLVFPAEPIWRKAFSSLER